jgi:hypothetical protein
MNHRIAKITIRAKKNTSKKIRKRLQRAKILIDVLSRALKMPKLPPRQIPLSNLNQRGDVG